VSIERVRDHGLRGIDRRVEIPDDAPLHALGYAFGNGLDARHGVVRIVAH